MSEETYEQKQKRLTADFDLVKPKPHWKGEILATIKQSDFNRANDACIYFTGSFLEVVSRDDAAGTYEVYAAGYWATIGS